MLGAINVPIEKEKSKLERDKMKKYDVANEPIVLSKAVGDLFLRQDNPGDLIALYWFYYYTAKWQGTNQPKASTLYAAKGLNWSEHRIRRVKQQLIQMKLIEDVVTRDEGQKVTGHYIYVRFIWSETTLTEIQRVENRKGNALSSNNKTNSKELEGGICDSTEITSSKRKSKLSHNSFKISQRTSSLIPSKKATTEKEPNPLIEYWNSLSGVRKHKNPNSKVYQDAVEMIKRVMGGLLKKRMLDSEWFNRHKIKHTRIGSALAFRTHLKNLSYMYQPGYWPEDKTWLKKLNLCDLIYNPRSRNSWLLAVAAEPPKLLSKALLDLSLGKDAYPAITADIRQSLNPEGVITDREMIQLLNGIGELVEFYEKIPKINYGDFNTFCSTPRNFINHYLKWLKDKKFTTGLFSINTGNSFKLYLDQRWGTDSTPLFQPLRKYLK